MSRKWQRSKQWDDEHFPAWAWPAKALLRAFSSIRLAIVLLVGVAIYGTLASIPVGLLALGVTWAFYSATVVGAVLLIAMLPSWILAQVLRRADRGVRFAASFLACIGLGVGAVVLWHRFAWPHLRWDPVQGTGVRFFADFVRAYESVTIRRLPGVEMTELEFYSWWPLRVLLLLFVTNMIVATVRRIEFTFKNLGVLTVHSGIVVIAMGSVLYQRFKKEGDTILLAAHATSAETDGAGPPQGAFYDNTEVVLYAGQRVGWDGRFRWEQRPIRRLPRYNDYALDAGSDQPGVIDSLWELLERPLPWEEGRRRELSIDLPQGTGTLVDPDIRFRIVGYAHYAEPREDWLRIDESQIESFAGSSGLQPMRTVELFSRLPAESGVVPESVGPAFRFSLFPRDPRHRVADNRVLAIEHTIGMDDGRWTDLGVELPDGTAHALVVEVPREDAETFRAVLAAEPGDRFELGTTGYTIGLKRLEVEPPFPIITEGYEDATSSLAVVEITAPAGADGERETFERWVYHRFPEISQDMLDETDPESGRPARRSADPAIRVSYIDASQLQVYFDEREDGSGRAIVRQPGGAVRVVDRVEPGERVADVVPQIDLAIGEGWAHAERFERPVPVEEHERNAELIGSHDTAMVAVEVSLDHGAEDGWRRVVWVPFSKFMGLARNFEREVGLPDGRSVRVAFGRRQHAFPGFELQLVDFEMIAYDHRGAPRDYQSIVRVRPKISFEDGPAFETYEHVTRLNAPLRAPFHWSDERSWAANMALRLTGGLSPNQFKLSQAGWDQAGWNESQQLADQGLTDRPRANFTILGVGNNPGIHIIALGGVMMGVGIPWAFYVKPWLVRREKARVQAAAAASGADGLAQRSRGQGQRSDRPSGVEVMA